MAICLFLYPASSARFPDKGCMKYQQVQLDSSITVSGPDSHAYILLLKSRRGTVGFWFPQEQECPKNLSSTEFFVGGANFLRQGLVVNPYAGRSKSLHIKISSTLYALPQKSSCFFGNCSITNESWSKHLSPGGVLEFQV